ncbi:hypothetical protein XENTR_v10004929 [Xenopus tropicalis]|nr:hypothetical protein XENTR_v10004929 [Xenopus tropicalis]
MQLNKRTQPFDSHRVHLSSLRSDYITLQRVRENTKQILRKSAVSGCAERVRGEANWCRLRVFADVGFVTH